MLRLLCNGAEDQKAMEMMKLTNFATIFFLSHIWTVRSQPGRLTPRDQEKITDFMENDENEENITSLKHVDSSEQKHLRVGDWHQTISASYDKNERPTKGLKEQTSVDVSIWIVKIYSISEAEMAYSVDFYYQEMWKDPRLAYHPKLFGNQTEISIPNSVLNQIWRPDTYFPSARTLKDPGDSITHTEVFRLRFDGSVWYSRRLALSADCPMDLTFYPFDKQDCKLRIGSYGQTIERMMYRWRDFKPVVFEKMVLPEFKIIDYSHKGKVLQYISNYSSLEFCFVIERSYGYCLIQVIIPAVAVVTSSWVALWLQDETQFSDVIAVIVAIIFLSYANNTTMPRVSYVKLMDAYLGFCFAFVFISLAKLVLLKYLKRRWNMKHSNDIDAEQEWRQQMNKAHIRKWTHAQSFYKNRRKSASSESSPGCFFACLSCFHITTQLLLPIAYGGCLFAALIYLPHLQSKRVMCE